MKKIIVFLFLASFFINTDAQELDIKWGKLTKVKKTGGRLKPYYEMVGTNYSAVLIVHYGKKGIVLDFFDKSSLQLIRSVPLGLKTLYFKDKKYKVKFYKAFIDRNNIYLFIYNNDSKKKKETFPLFVAKFNFYGIRTSEWRNISSVYASDQNKPKSKKYYTTITNRITYSPSLGLFFFNKSEQIDKTYGQYLFFDTSFNEVILDRSYNNQERLYLSKNGRVWMEYENNECIYFSEIKKSEESGEFYTGNKKCIPAIQKSSLEKVNTSVSTCKGLISDSKLQVLELIRSEGEYKEIRVRVLDLDKGSEELKDKYSFSQKEIDEFSKRYKAILTEKDEKRMTYGGVAYDESQKDKHLFQPEHIYHNQSFYSAEIRNRSYASKTKTSQNVQYTIEGFKYNYGDIFTFWYDTIKKEFIYKWINKRQTGFFNGEGLTEKRYSFIPLKIGDSKFFIFLGDIENFEEGSDKRYESSYRTGSIGYYKINFKNKVLHKVLARMKGNFSTTPYMQFYNFDGENLFLMIKNIWGNKIKVLKISPKN